MKIEFDTELALKLSKIVHDHCKDVPHDIGIKLAQEVFIQQLEKAGKRGFAAGEKARNLLTTC